MARPVEKREHIETGVVDVVARKGLRGTTIQDIATAANVSPGLLYRYWKNRDDLAADVYRVHVATLMTRLRARGADAADFWEMLGAMLDEFLLFADEKPTILKFILLSQHDLGASVAPEKGVRGLLGPLLTAAMDRGQVRRMPLDLALHFTLGLTIQPVIATIYGHLPRPTRQHSSAILAAMRRVLKV